MSSSKLIIGSFVLLRYNYSHKHPKIRIFAARIAVIKMLLKRRISGFILLSVILPMVFLAPFHHHENSLSQEISCTECSHHQPHPGHLTQNSGTDECLVCQLLAQVYVPTVGPVVNLLSPHYVTIGTDFSGDAVLCFTPQSSPRAPPVSFCF